MLSYRADTNGHNEDNFSKVHLTAERGAFKADLENRTYINQPENSAPNQRYTQISHGFDASGNISRLAYLRPIQLQGGLNSNMGPLHVQPTTSLAMPAYIDFPSMVDNGQRNPSNSSNCPYEDPQSLSSSRFEYGIGPNVLRFGNNAKVELNGDPSFTATPSLVAALPSQGRKPCNCNKSHCLKLYCECFAQGQLCQNCNCLNCMNNLQYEDERARAIKLTLDRNPLAFHPKIGRGEGERKHTKGCQCKKSGCLKNYCECYEAKISCSDLCRCLSCRNTDDEKDKRSLVRLSTMTQAVKARQYDYPYKSFIGPAPETLPHSFITWEVAEACCGCLLARADDAEACDVMPVTQERIILEEFGRCLGQIVEAARKSQPLPPYASEGAASAFSSNVQHSSASTLIMNLPGNTITEDVGIQGIYGFNKRADNGLYNA